MTEAEKDRDILARTLWGEARGELMAGTQSATKADLLPAAINVKRPRVAPKRIKRGSVEGCPARAVQSTQFSVSPFPSVLRFGAHIFPRSVSSIP